MTDTVFEYCDIIHEYQDLLDLCVFHSLVSSKHFFSICVPCQTIFSYDICIFASSFDYFSLKRL